MFAMVESISAKRNRDWEYKKTFFFLFECIYFCSITLLKCFDETLFPFVNILTLLVHSFQTFFKAIYSNVKSEYLFYRLLITKHNLQIIRNHNQSMNNIGINTMTFVLFFFVCI